MNNDEKKIMFYLIEAIINELLLYDKGHVRKSLPKTTYVPEYLQDMKEKENRDRVIKELKRLKKILNENHLNAALTVEDVKILIVAVLFCEWKRLPFYEYIAHKEFFERFEKYRAKHKTDTKFFLNDPKEISDIEETIGFLIKYNKIACLILNGRLFETTHKTIEEKIGNLGISKRLLGTMAAICYDSPGEHTESSQEENREEIIKAWIENHYRKKKYTIPEKNGVTAILYDLPICGKQDERSRGPHDKTLFENFMGFWDEFKADTKNDIKGEEIYLTCHYTQSRFLSSDLETFENGEMKIDLIAGVRTLRKKYEFKDVTPKFEKEKSKPEDARVYEFRLKEEGLPDLIGASDYQTKHPKKLDEWKMIRELSQGNHDKAVYDYYPFPIKDYFPLPLLGRFFTYLKDYRKDDIEEIVFDFHGQLDDDFKKYFEIHAPQKKVPGFEDDANSHMIPTIEKFLAAYAVNIGICAGYDNLEIRSDEKKGGYPWSKRINAILKNKKYGYHVLLHYIECFMRSHDLNLVGDKYVNPGKYEDTLLDIIEGNETDGENGKNESGKNQNLAIGVDIGATSIKFTIYETENIDDISRWKPFPSKSKTLEKRCGTQKNPANKNDKYKDLGDFTERIKENIDKLLDEANKDWENVAIVGVCWPGAIRDQKIAGASGILKYFDDGVGSNWTLRNNVEKIRKLNLIKELKNKLPEEKEITIGVCNDGYAEALAIMIDDKKEEKYFSFPEDINPKWAVLKLGTGTAGQVFTRNRTCGGLIEFGKMMLNVYLSDQAKHDLGNEDRFPIGNVNGFASASLLPNVFREVAEDLESFNVSSFEVGRLGEFFLGGKKMSIEDVIKDIGRNYLHQEKLEHVTSNDILKNICAGNEKEFEKVSKVLNATNLKTIEELIEKIKNVGGERVVKILRALIKRDEPVKFLSKCSDHFAIAEKLLNEMEENKQIKDKYKDKFKEIFSRSGSLLADVIMLIHEYYKINGVVICGGVIQKESAVTNKMMNSVKEHLRRKYFVHFAGLKQYREDAKERLIGKKSFTTIYHNFEESETEDKDKEYIRDSDKAEIGTIYHGHILRKLVGEKNREKKS